MTCPKFENLSLHVDGASPEGVAAHVDVCKRCARTVAAIRSGDEVLRDLAAVSASEREHAKVSAETLGKLDALKPATRRRYRAKRSKLVPIAALAASFILLLLGVLFFLPKGEPPVVDKPDLRPVEYVLLTGKIEEGRAVERSILALKDGTEITLREGTTFELGKSTKETILRIATGEVFIDSPKRERPFLVRTPHTNVTIVGTAFNVKAADAGTEVAVIHGTVRVADRRVTEGAGVAVDAEGTLGASKPIEPAVAKWANDARAAANLIPNPGFEDDFTNWETGIYDKTKLLTDADAYEGRKSCLIRSTASEYYIHWTPRSFPIDIEPGATYLFVCHVKSDNLEGGKTGGLYLQVSDAKGWEKFHKITPFLQGTFGWTKFTFEVTMPAETTQVHVVCTNVKDGAPIRGEFRIDALGLYKISR